MFSVNKNLVHDVGWFTFYGINKGNSRRVGQDCVSVCVRERVVEQILPHIVLVCTDLSNLFDSTAIEARHARNLCICVCICTYACMCVRACVCVYPSVCVWVESTHVKHLLLQVLGQFYVVWFVRARESRLPEPCVIPPFWFPLPSELFRFISFHCLPFVLRQEREGGMLNKKKKKKSPNFLSEHWFIDKNSNEKSTLSCFLGVRGLG